MNSKQRAMLRGMANTMETILYIGKDGVVPGTIKQASDALDERVNEELIGSIVGGKIQLPDLHKDEDVLKAVRALVANEPDLAIMVIKGWLAEDAKEARK